jgi:hypothetical protein
VFEIRDDLFGDLLIEVVAVGKGIALRCRDGGPPRVALDSSRRRWALSVGRANKRSKIASDDTDDD